MKPERRSHIIDARMKEIKVNAKYAALCIHDAFQGRLSNGLASNSKKSWDIFTAFKVQTSDWFFYLIIYSCFFHCLSVFLFAEIFDESSKLFFSRILHCMVLTVYVTDVALKMKYEGFKEYFKHDWQKVYVCCISSMTLNLLIWGDITFANVFRPAVAILRSRGGRRFFTVVRQMLPKLSEAFIPLGFVIMVIVACTSLLVGDSYATFNNIQLTAYNWVWLTFTCDTFSALLPEQFSSKIAYVAIFFASIYFAQKFLLSLILGATFDLFSDMSRKQVQDENMKAMKGLVKAFSVLDDFKEGKISQLVFTLCMQEFNPKLGPSEIALYYEIISGGSNTVSVLQFLALRYVLSFKFTERPRIVVAPPPAAPVSPLPSLVIPDPPDSQTAAPLMSPSMRRRSLSMLDEPSTISPNRRRTVSLLEGKVIGGAEEATTLHPMVNMQYGSDELEASLEEFVSTHISPRRKSQRLTDDQLKELANHKDAIVQAAISGTTPNSPGGSGKAGSDTVSKEGKEKKEEKAGKEGKEAKEGKEDKKSKKNKPSKGWVESLLDWRNWYFVSAVLHHKYRAELLEYVALFDVLMMLLGCYDVPIFKIPFFNMWSNSFLANYGLIACSGSAREFIATPCSIVSVLYLCEGIGYVVRHFKTTPAKTSKTTSKDDHTHWLPLIFFWVAVVILIARNFMELLLGNIQNSLITFPTTSLGIFFWVCFNAKIMLFCRFIRCGRMLVLNEELKKLFTSFKDVAPTFFQLMIFAFTFSYTFSMLGNWLFSFKSGVILGGLSDKIEGLTGEEVVDDWESPIGSFVTGMSLFLPINYVDVMERTNSYVSHSYADKSGNFDPSAGLINAVLIELWSFNGGFFVKTIAESVSYLFFIIYFVMSVVICNLSLSIIIEWYSECVTSGDDNEEQKAREEENNEILFKTIVERAVHRRILKKGRFNNAVRFSTMTLERSPQLDHRHKIFGGGFDLTVSLHHLKECQKYATIDLDYHYHKHIKEHRNLDEETEMLFGLRDNEQCEVKEIPYSHFLFPSGGEAVFGYFILNGLVEVLVDNDDAGEIAPNGLVIDRYEVITIPSSNFVGMECFTPDSKYKIGCRAKRKVKETEGNMEVVNKPVKVLEIPQEVIVHGMDPRIAGVLLRISFKTSGLIENEHEVARARKYQMR